MEIDKCVYFIRSENGNIKIGYSSDVVKRFSALQGASSEALSLLRVIVGNREYEKALHHRFRHLSAHREWFKPGEDLLEFINGLSDYYETHKKNLKRAKLRKSLLERGMPQDQIESAVVVIERDFWDENGCWNGE